MTDWFDAYTLNDALGTTACSRWCVDGNRIRVVQPRRPYSDKVRLRRTRLILPREDGSKCGGALTLREKSKDYFIKHRFGYILYHISHQIWAHKYVIFKLPPKTVRNTDENYEFRRKRDEHIVRGVPSEMISHATLSTDAITAQYCLWPWRLSVATAK